MFGWLRNLIGRDPDEPRPWWKDAAGKSIEITMVATGAPYVRSHIGPEDTFRLSNGDLEAQMPMTYAGLEEQCIFRGLVDGRVVYGLIYVTEVEDFGDAHRH